MSEEKEIVQSKYLKKIPNVRMSDKGLEKLIGIYLSQTINNPEILQDFFLKDKDTLDLPTRTFQTIVMAVVGSMAQSQEQKESDNKTKEDKE